MKVNHFSEFYISRYQQLLHAGLALYAYMHIIHGRKVDLGKGDWKLHVGCFILIFLLAAVIYPLNGFGPSGYWMLLDVRTTAGTCFGVFIAVTTTAQAVLTVMGASKIRSVVKKQKEIDFNQTRCEAERKKRLSTAYECLTTYVVVSVTLYCSLSVVFIIFMIESSVFGVIEPVTCFLIVVFANSSGWAIGVGYFRNLKLKRRRVESEGSRKSASSVNSSSTVVSSC